MLALFVPLLLVGLVDGRRGLRQTWPIALFTGAVFAVAQFTAANFISVELTDVIASLAGLAAAVLFLRVWQPSGGEAAAETLRIESEREHSELAAGSSGAAGTTTKARPATSDTHARPSRDKILMAFLPYLIVIVVFAVAKLWKPAKTFLVGQDVKIKWPGLDGNILSASGKPSTATVYTLPWLSSPGTLLLICGVVTAVIYRVAARDAIGEYTAVLNRMKYALLTVSSVLALAYVMNFSGQTITIGTWIAAAGAAFAFFSPILGWLGTAVTGSDTSANALFATLQQTVGVKTGIDPTLLVSANTSGGVLGKMISPQNLTIAATSVGLAGRESDIFRKVVLWSLGLLLAMCVLVYLQSTPVLSWMLG